VILGKQCIPHDSVAFGCVTRTPIISRRCSLVRNRTRAVRKGPVRLPLIRNTGVVLVCPIGRYVAVIVLQIVNAPGCKGGCVKEFDAKRCRIAPTSFSSGTAVNSNLEAKCVDGVGDANDSLGELGWVGDDLASYVVTTGLDRPAIIDLKSSEVMRSMRGRKRTIYITVASIFET
jgi:hypothetical protein